MEFYLFKVLGGNPAIWIRVIRPVGWQKYKDKYMYT